MNVVQALMSTWVAGAGLTQSAWVTFTFIMTQEYEGWVPVVITNPNTTAISCGAEVTLYRSTDYGLTWETVGTFGTAFPRPAAASEVQRRDVLITPGWFLVAVTPCGGNATTWTVQLGTAWVITAQI